MLGRARKGFNHVLDDLADFTPRRLRHTLAAGSMLFMLYSCGDSSSGGGSNVSGTTYQCNNGKDDDGDGLVDMKDPGCTSTTDNSEYNAPLNNPPVVSSTFSPVSLAEDSATSVALAGHFSDPDGDALTYSVNGFADVIAAVAGDQINISAPADYNGTDSGNVRACDPSNACVTTTLDVTFTPVNDAPIINSISVFSALEGAVFDGQINAADPDIATNGDFLTYLIVNNVELPELKVNATTGQLYSDAALGYSLAGDKNVLIRVDDSLGLLDTNWYVLTIANTNRAPTITDVVINQAEEGKVLDGGILGNDPDGGSVTCYPISSTLPEAKVDPLCTIYSDAPLPAAAPVNYNIVVGMTDGVMDDTFSRDFEVQRPPTTPTATCDGNPCGPNFGVSEDPWFPLTFTLNSTDPNGDPVTYVPGSPLPSGATLDSNTGVFSWSPTCSQGSVIYTLGFKGNDGIRLSDVYTVWITVNDVCPP